MFNNINLDFFYYVVILLSLVVAFTAFKVANCKPFNMKGEDFDARKLILGSSRHLIAIIGLALVYVACSLFGNELVVLTIGGTKFSIPDALNLIMLTAVVNYSAKFVINAADYFGIKSKIPVIKEPRK